jgi:hypothetical protein
MLHKHFLALNRNKKAQMEWLNYCREHVGKPGHNEYGVPLHACNGYCQDEHYWKWLEHKRLQREGSSK